jgi:hypothetical protein
MDSVWRTYLQEILQELTVDSECDLSGNTTMLSWPIGSTRLDYSMGRGDRVWKRNLTRGSTDNSRSSSRSHTVASPARPDQPCGRGGNTQRARMNPSIDGGPVQELQRARGYCNFISPVDKD